MIKKLNVKGVRHRFDYDLEFNGDINVLTGLNGSAKTTLLMLIWYLISGNLHRIMSEIPFALVKIETSWFDLSMERTSEDKVELEWEIENRTDMKTVTLGSKSPLANLDTLNEHIAGIVQGSQFFPTFRRIERGYTDDPIYRELQKAMSGFSGALSNENDDFSHKFSCVVSTGDISPLLLSKKERQEELLGKQNTSDDEDEEVRTLEERFLLLEDIVRDIYDNYKIIKVSDVIKFDAGKGRWEISSEDLSSGEKQLLGFLCHNAFSTDKAMFLDEPELSLHVDYQRLILPLLYAQGTEKQFFVATHSPYIYYRYPEKEINLERHPEKKINLEEKTNESAS